MTNITAMFRTRYAAAVPLLMLLLVGCEEEHYDRYPGLDHLGRGTKFTENAAVATLLNELDQLCSEEVYYPIHNSFGSYWWHDREHGIPSLGWFELKTKGEYWEVSFRVAFSEYRSWFGGEWKIKWATAGVYPNGNVTGAWIEAVRGGNVLDSG